VIFFRTLAYKINEWEEGKVRGERGEEKGKRRAERRGRRKKRTREGGVRDNNYL
jgi:hypothetical protein